MVQIEARGERSQFLTLPLRMEALLGLDGYGIPTGAFKEIYKGIGSRYNRWTREILDKPVVHEALRGADRIVELGCGHEAAVTKIVAEMLKREGVPLRGAVLLDFNPMIADYAIASVSQTGMEEVSFERLDLRTPEGLQKVKELGGPETIIAARALLNQLGRGADRIIDDVFPAFGRGVVLDLDHPLNNEAAWAFSPVNADDEAERAVVNANRLTQTLYGLLETDGRQLLGSRLGRRLEEAGLNVVHHEVVPHDPSQELITDIPFADVPRLIATIVAYNLSRGGTALPLKLEEFEQELTDYDQVLELIGEGRVEVTTIQFGGAVWSGRK